MTSSEKQTAQRSSWWDRLLGNKKVAAPRVPAGKRVYAVGDIHGRHDLLLALIRQICQHALESPAAENSLLFVGDYVDRGEASKDVIELLLTLDLPGWQKIFLRGNHDQSVLNFLEDYKFYRVWRGYGAQETLLSYGVTPPRFDDDSAFARTRDEFAEKLPATHLAFLNGLRYFHVEGDYLFVHAGLRPGIALDKQSQEDMLWIRDDFLFSREVFAKYVVHGHTPGTNPVRLKNRICIDTGAYVTGRLTAVVLEDDSCSFLTTS
jgi:serine/threonine protein phosphatase 1